MKTPPVLALGLAAVLGSCEKEEPPKAVEVVTVPVDSSATPPPAAVPVEEPVAEEESPTPGQRLDHAIEAKSPHCSQY